MKSDDGSGQEMRRDVSHYCGIKKVRVRGKEIWQEGNEDIFRPKTKPESVSRRGNVTPASSGRVDGPAACAARRGPDGVRGAVDFCEPAKIHDSPGLPTGDIPSR